VAKLSERAGVLGEDETEEASLSRPPQAPVRPDLYIVASGAIIFSSHEPMEVNLIE
jgi:hypothetical protein